MTAAQEEVSPYLKKHNNETICFADTVTQVSNALKRTHLGAEANADDLNNAHLMLFGVEDWTPAKAKTLAVDFRDPKNNFTRLEIFGCEIKEDAQKELAKGFDPKNMTSVRQFDLDNTALTAGGASDIFKNIAECDAIEKINLQGSIPNKAVMKAIEEALADQVTVYKTLNHLDLKINDLKEDYADHIYNLMTRFVNPVHLDLFYNALKTPGAQAIGRALGQNANIVHLDLCCNDIGDAGAVAIGNALKHNTHIETLKLALNNIGNVGGMAIMEALAPVAAAGGVLRNKSLKILDLSANVMKEEADTPMTDDEKALDGALAALAIEEDKLGSYRDENLSNEAIVEQVEAQIEDINTRRRELMRGRTVVWQPRPFRSQLIEVWTQANLGLNGLLEFDFTGVEFDATGWAAMGTAMQPLSGALPIEREKCKIKFSIVDLMSKANLDILEPYIWKRVNDGKTEWLYKNYDCIDWRRLPKEEEVNAANNANN